MNCEKVQRRLLGQLHPERVPATLKAHLEECATCRDYQRHLVQIERSIPRLQAPPAPLAKARLLHEIRTQPTWWAQVRTQAATLPRRVQRLQRWQIVAGLAAAVLLLVVAWRIIPGSGDPAEGDVAKKAMPDPLLARLHQHTLTLAASDKPRQQVEGLADVADDLHGAAQKLGHEPASRDLRDLADWYAKVVDVQVERAGAVPTDERAAILEPLVQRLARTVTEADRLARETRGASGSSALAALASSARDARAKLEALSRPAGAGLERPAEEPVATDPLAPRSPGPLSMGPFVLSAASVLRADEPIPPSASEDLRRFRRNHPLLRALVNGSVELAKASDQFKRAQLCTSVARCFAEEIQSAASHREGPRTAELGQQLSDILQRGVAANLSSAVNSTPVGSARDVEFQKLNRDMDDVMGPLEEQLETAGDVEPTEYVQRALQAVRSGRSEVAKALQGRGGPMRPELRRVD